ncbi:hypothetical protein Ahy_B10g104928 [Arachis hypogaea]|uniref:Transposase MuDR plant domain-containing protein n=1 Tax=Arachis hypogaea TaxID=3818 RepID=A0A444X6Q7_ARAHY|nr:hypothetical protein Ahy_B10g104928 [Arachis hypogaea]
MQEMFSMYIESCAQMSFIELYIEFEQSEANRNIEREDYNSDSEEEFESNYEVVGPDGDEDQGDDTIETNVTDVANTLANEHPFDEPSFMQALDLEAIHALKFSEYMNADYRVYESKSLTFYAKCTPYESGCDWLIRVIRRYNSSHTCTRAAIFQDHSKLDSNTIAEAIKPLVEADPSIKVKSVIAEVQSKFNYTISYRKAWLAKKMSLEKIFGVWKASYETLPI